MTSSSFKIDEDWDFHFYKRPEPPFGSRKRLDHKTTRSQVLSLKVNYTVNCAVNCCNRVLHFLRIRSTCGFLFAWKTPKFQYILTCIVGTKGRWMCVHWKKKRGWYTLLSFFNAEEIPAEHKNAELIIAILPLNRNIKTRKFTHELSPSQY